MLELGDDDAVLIERVVGQRNRDGGGPLKPAYREYANRTLDLQHPAKQDNTVAGSSPKARGKSVMPPGLTGSLVRNGQVASQYGLAFLDAVQYGFDIQDGSPVKGLQVRHSELCWTDNLEYSNAMNANWIGPILRACAEHAGQRCLRVVPWMHLEYFAIRLVEPGQNQKVVSALHMGQCWTELFVEHEPRVRRTLVSLLWCVFPIGERRSDMSDRIDIDHCHLEPIPERPDA